MDGTGFTFALSGPEERRISVKPTEFLKGVSKAVIKAAAGSYVDAIAELPDIAASLGLKATPQKRVGLLVLRALERSLVALVAEVAKEHDEITPDVHAASFLGLSEKVTFEIDRDFFLNPNAEGLVEVLRPDAERWLNVLGLPPIDINNILTRLPTIFVRALHEEWRSNTPFYIEVLDATDSPFLDAAIMEQEWARYNAHIIALGEERVFDESFSLRQIYVSPRCYFNDAHNKTKSDQTFSVSLRHREEPMRILRWAHSEIISWINRQDSSFSIRTVAGGPGSGKSSFAKIIAADLALDGRRVLFVPLHLVDLELGIARAISDYFKQTGHFSEDPLLLESNNPVILILDGLDEIQMQGKAAQESAQSFVNDLTRYVDRRNATSCKLLCMITGRDLAVQSAEGSLRIEGQVIHLAPYSIPENERSSFEDADNLVKIDQRDEWWSSYGSLTGLPYKSMPDTLRAGELDEVTSQPLLNYLVALSYRRGLQLDETTNVNSVYEDLLKAVYDRAWARHSHPSVKDVPYESFVRLLEEVALSVWHGAGRTTTLDEVEAHCQQSKVGALLPNFQSGVSSGVSSLLLAFYFRQKGRRDDGSKTFEFTHKTFAEYLTSLRIVRMVDLVSNQLSAHDIDPDLGMDEQDALHRWLNICGQTPLDRYLLDFIRREFAFRSPDRAVVLQKSLSALLEAALRAGWPIQRIPRLSFSEQQSYVRNGEETLVACLNACALVSKEVSIIRWASETSAGEMVSRLQGQRKGPTNRPIMECLSYMNYDGQYLDIADLYRAELHHSSFVGSHLNYTVLMYANLSRATFVGAKLEGVNLSGATLLEARMPLEQIIRNRIGMARGPILDERGSSSDSGGLLGQRAHRRLQEYLQRGMIIVDETGAPMSEERVRSEIADSAARSSAKNETPKKVETARAATVRARKK